jgi:O-antigen/teichoic acid export membrane protein
MGLGPSTTDADRLHPIAGSDPTQDPAPASSDRSITRLARNAAVYGTGQVLLRLISLLLLPVFTSFLTPTDYGISSILGLLTLLVTPVFALGISGSLGVVYFEIDDPRRKISTIWTAFGTLALSAAALLVAGAVAAPVIGSALFPANPSGYDLPYLVTVSILTAAVSIAAQPLLVSLQLEERARMFVAITVGSAVISIVLSLLFIVVMGRGVAGFIEAGAIAQTLALLLTLAVTLGHARPAFRRELANELLRLGLPLVPAFLAIFVMQQSNKYLLQAASGLDEVGVYTVGFNLGMFATLVVSGFTAAWFPFFSSFMNRQAAATVLFGRILTYYVLAVGTFSLLFYVGARPVILLLTHGPFHGAYVAVGPSATAQFLIGVHSVLLATMYFAKEVRFQLVIQGAAAAVSVGLNLVLIPLLGIAGAALALASGVLVMVLLQQLWNVRRRYLQVAYDGRRLRRFATLYVVTAVIFSLDRDLPLAAEVTASIVATAVILAVVVWLLTTEERAQARSALRSVGRRIGAVR